MNKEEQDIHYANKGKHWFTNGEISKLCYECPDGFVIGRIKFSNGFYTKMTKEEFYDRFLKVVRPEHNVFKPLTKELMIENGLLDEFTECVEKGIFSPIKKTEQYFINWDLLKSYIKDQSSNTAKENTAKENTTKLIADMVKEIADLKKEVRKQVKENADLKEQVIRLQNELNAKETKDEVDELLEKI